MNETLQARASSGPSVLDIEATRQKLERSGGGQQVVYMSPALEVCVEVFNSPGLGELRVEDRDALYMVLDGSGMLGVENGDPLALVPGEAVVVPVGASHVIFGNPRLSLLIVTTTSQSARSSHLAAYRPI
jgi:mannose-6-phosphate isomerase-like protein (cupin superfamily)